MCFRAFLQDPDDNDITTVTTTVTDGLVSLTPEEIDCSPSIEDGTLSPVYPYPMANRDNQIKNVEKCPDSLSDEVELPTITYQWKLLTTRCQITEMKNSLTAISERTVHPLL